MNGVNEYVEDQANLKPNKVPLLFIAFFAGNFGIHRFYLKSNLIGVFYLLFAWTQIPGIIALGECVYFALQSEDKIQAKYPKKGSPRVMLLLGIITFLYVVVMFLVAGILIKKHGIA